MLNPSSRFAVVAFVSLWCWFSGCHADPDDPAGQAKELKDPVRREHAINNLQRIYGKLLADAKGDRSAENVKEFADVTHAQLTKVYLEHPEDKGNGLRILKLIHEMREPRAIPALVEALDWTLEVSEEHAITAARTLAAISVPDGEQGTIIDALCKALERIDGARAIDNRMRKAFIEALGAIGDKRATPCLEKVVLAQTESQNFLFNILAARQLAHIADPAAIDTLIKALYLFAPKNPAMRMNDVASEGLVAIGRPALDPLLKLLDGNNAEAKKVVENYIQAIRQRDPNAAAQMSVESIIVNEATYTLGKLGYPEALTPLLEKTESDDAQQRFAAAIALVGIEASREDVPKIVSAMQNVYESMDKKLRPQMLVAMRHLYEDSVMPFLLRVATEPERELPEIRLHAFESYALLANAEEAPKLRSIISQEQLYKKQLQDHLPTIEAAKECDEKVECWIDKLGDDDKLIVRKAANMLARVAKGNDKAVAALVKQLDHSDLQVRVEALHAISEIAKDGSKEAIAKIDELQEKEGGRSIWNRFKREALPFRSRMKLRTAS